MKIQFEKQFGKGVDPWHAKARRWVKKKFKNPYLQHLALGFIEWLKQKWIDVKVANTMRDIDRQSEEIKKIWEEKDKPKTIITTTPSEVKGLDDIKLPRKELKGEVDIWNVNQIHQMQFLFLENKRIEQAENNLTQPSDAINNALEQFWEVQDGSDGSTEQEELL